MGSAKVPNAKPQTMDNNKFKPLSILKSFFHKDKKKEKAREKELILKNEPKHTKNTIENAETTVATILEPFRKLNLQKNDKPSTKVEEINDEIEEDELDNFTFKVIEDDKSSTRIESQSSQDSGFSDLNSDVTDDFDKLTINNKTDRKDKDITKEYEDEAIRNEKELIKSENEIKTEIKEHKNDIKIEKDEEEEKEDKKKRLHQVVVKRTPIRSKLCDYSSHPYAKDTENLHKPISQINQKCLSGGNFIVNQPAESELEEALPFVANLYQQNQHLFDDVLDVINKDVLEDTNKDCRLSTIDSQVPNIDFNFPTVPGPVATDVPNMSELFSYDDSVSALLGTFPKTDIFPTPPHSVPSPLSDVAAFYPSVSDYTLSSERSSPYNSDFEKYQEISPYSCDEEDLKRDRTSSVSHSSMTMKNFKDLQKEIANGFSKKECCDISQPCKEVFEEHMKKLKSAERTNLCLQVSKLDSKNAYGVIFHIILSLSNDSSQVDLDLCLFKLICERVLAENPALFVGDFGLSILKAAVMRCPQYHILTRYIVQCVYLVLRSDPKLCPNEFVFNEVDPQGDNLVLACARAGDDHALALAEITRNDNRGELPPLFRLQHNNSDGYTALHLACRLHSAASPRLHIVHVLLDHANADIWKGDIKGGDTPLHLAVNSSTCSLQLVMLLFRNQDRKLWKKLAHAQNMSSVTPLEYARSAAKSTTRQNYPHEVLDFLKKCR